MLEAGDAVGGRVRTDIVDGFLLDRGFQVLLTAYPEAKRLLDEALAMVPAEYHEAMLTNVRVNREITAAWDLACTCAGR